MQSRTMAHVVGNQPRCGIGGYRYDRLAVALLSTLTGAGVGAEASTIDIDGRTETRVNSNGSGTFEITTKTTSGGNAFNSFRHFRISRSHEANLRLPEGSDRLINLVHDSRA